MDVPVFIRLHSFAYKSFKIMMPAFWPTTGQLSLKHPAPRDNRQTVLEVGEHHDKKARPSTATKLYVRKILVAYSLRKLLYTATLLWFQEYSAWDHD